LAKTFSGAAIKAGFNRPPRSRLAKIALMRPAVLQLADLSPANFAIVMATGILGVGSQQQGYPRLALGLLAVTLLTWIGLAALSAVAPAAPP
jgi:hypothetical protein